MHKLFRSTRILYWVLCSFFLLLFASQTLLAWPFLSMEVDGVMMPTLRLVEPLFDLGSSTADLLVWSAVVILGIFLSVMAVNLLALAKYRRILAPLYDDCDPDRFLAAAAPLLSVASAPAAARVMIRNDFAVGLITRGDFEKAWGILENLQPSGKGPRMALTLAVIAHNRAAARLGLQDVEAAKGFRDEMARMEPALVSEHRLLATYRNRLDRLDYRIRIAEGNFEGAREFFEAVLPTCRNEYERVETRSILASVYEAAGDESGAKESLEYVAAHGNNLWTARMARRKLGLETPVAD